MSWRNYWDKVTRYFAFSNEEISAFVITVLVFAFIDSFDQWGYERFDVLIGLKNYLISLIIVGTALFVHHAAQRLAAIRTGFRAEHKLWWHGLVLGLILVVFTRGTVELFVASGVFIHMLAAHRLGVFRYGPNIDTYAMIALWGPLANIFFATVVKTLELWTPLPLNPEIVQAIFVFNLGFAALNMLPIPPLDGSRVFFASRLTYAFVAGTIIGYVALIYFFNAYSYIFALLIGGAVWLLFLIFFESHWRK